MSVEDPKTEAVAWLRQQKLRATKPRVEIVQVLRASLLPLTLAEIHAQVRAAGCDFATVFRFVTRLEDRELVERVAWLDGSVRHEIKQRPGHEHHHHYLICRSCQKVEPLEECIVERLETEVAQHRGYAELRHSLQLSGICPGCVGSEAAKK